MPSLRSMDFSATVPAANRVLWAWFVAITAPTGALRYVSDWVSKFPAASQLSYSLDLGDGSGAHDWAFDNGSDHGGAYGLQCGPISQGDQGSSVVSWVSIIDLDGTIYNLANTVFSDNTVGLCGRPVDVWRVQFDPDTFAALGANLFFRGKVDSQQYGASAVLSLDPFRTRQREAPWLTADQLGAASLRPDVGRTIQYYG